MGSGTERAVWKDLRIMAVYPFRDCIAGEQSIAANS